MKRLLKIPMLKAEGIEISASDILGRGVTTIVTDNSDGTVTMYTVDLKKFDYLRELESFSNIDLKLTWIKDYDEFSMFTMVKLVSPYSSQIDKRLFNNTIFSIHDQLFEIKFSSSEYSNAPIDWLIPVYIDAIEKGEFVFPANKFQLDLKTSLRSTMFALSNIVTNEDVLDIHPEQFMLDESSQTLLCIDPIITQKFLSYATT